MEVSFEENQTIFVSISFNNPKAMRTRNQHFTTSCYNLTAAVSTPHQFTPLHTPA